MFYFMKINVVSNNTTVSHFSKQKRFYTVDYNTNYSIPTRNFRNDSGSLPEVTQTLRKDK